MYVKQSACLMVR